MNSKFNEIRANMIVCNRYRLIHDLGSGTFGCVFLGKDIKSNDLFALKIESKYSHHQQLKHEFKMYQRISKHAIEGIPRIRCFFEDHQNYCNIMVMDRLGASLEKLFNYCGRKFSIKTVLMLFFQMIDRVEQIHCKNIIHRDIKPENFLVGINNSINTLYLIDFGLSKEYMICDSADSLGRTTYRHLPLTKGHNFVGTSKYASINVHKGIQQSRRDDLESLGYIMIYFLRGSLPWQNLRVNHAINNNCKQRNERILEKKLSTTLGDLCHNFPTEFLVYMSYCRSRKFEQEPNYAYVREIFSHLFRKMNYMFDLKFDWTGHISPITGMPAQSHLR